MSGGLSVHFRSAAADIPAAVWARCFGPETEGFFWFDLLERSELNDQFTFEYAVVERHDEAIAIAPLFMMDLPIEVATPPALMPVLGLVKRLAPKLYWQRTLFVGAPGADEGALGLVAGVDLANIVHAVNEAAFERAKQARASMLVWKDFPSQYWVALRTVGKPLRLFEVVSFPNTRIDQPGVDFDAYLRRLSTDRRSKLRSKLRKSRAACDLRAAVVSGLQPGLIDELWPLYEQTFAKAKVKFEHLTRAFFAQAMTCEQSATIVLRDAASGRPVAFMLCFLVGRRALNKYIGIDYQYDQQSFLYFRLFEEFVHWAQAQGARELQSGQTAYRPKLDLGHRLIPLSNFVRHRNWLVHRVFALVARHIGWETLDTGLREHIEAKARRNAGGALAPAGDKPKVRKTGNATQLGRSIEQ